MGEQKLMLKLCEWQLGLKMSVTNVLGYNQDVEFDSNLLCNSHNFNFHDVAWEEESFNILSRNWEEWVQCVEK